MSGEPPPPQFATNTAAPPKPETVEAEGAATLRRQRDTAREQRDIARAQRDESRYQRDELRRKLAQLETELASHRQGHDHGHVEVTRDLSDIDCFQYEIDRAPRLQEVRDKQSSGIALTVRETELLAERLVVPVARQVPSRPAPGPDIGFLTVANAAFFPGLEGLLLSLLDVYPDMRSPIHICHDGTLSAFLQARLRSFYANLVFLEPDMGWFAGVPTHSDNHRRIGRLGYMNMEALALTGFSRIVVLDSDLIVRGDISELWQGGGYRVCHDCGDREYAIRSAFTGDWVINSGVISIPGEAAGPEAYQAFRALTESLAASPVCPALDRFSDQKIWNIFLRDKPKTFLPVNYNCNVKYLAKYLNGAQDGISILHFAGPKPWNSKDFLNSDQLQPERSRALRYPRPWIDAYRDLLFRQRLTHYRAHAAANRRTRPVRSDNGDDAEPTCVMIGNGPSLLQTDLSPTAGVEKFAFNWFILSDQFDALRPEHLVLASHMLFGGWATSEPRFPPGYLETLKSRRHRPVLWTSFYFREFLESIGLDRDFEINYGLFEKPFKRFVDRIGRCEPEMDAFLADGRTGVLSLGVPAAVSMGFKRILLVGCDSNYSRPGEGARYFYDIERHSSAQTDEAELAATWTEAGRGQYAYRLASEALARRRISLIDCTVGGALRSVARADLAQVLSGRTA